MTVPGIDWRGAAFLAIANTVDPAVLDAYEAWHSFEHVPERLTMPGFLGGRRFERGDRSDRHFLTLYDLGAEDALETPEYHHLLANPTPASQRMRPRMGGFQRCAYRETARFGRGCGRCLGFLRWNGAMPGENPVNAQFAALIGQSGIVSVRLGAAVETRPHPAFPPDPASSASHAVALLSGTDRAGLAGTLAAIAARLEGTVLASEIYDLILAY